LTSSPERLVEAFTAPFAIDGREWTITASIGVAAADVGNRPAGRPREGRPRDVPLEARGREPQLA
jgi:hypothetical protein